MIHLDTNILIGLEGLLRSGNSLVTRMQQGEKAAVSAIAWFEFLNGPVTPTQTALAFAFVQQRVLPFNVAAAAIAAQLFNAAGRKRALKIDILITAAALEANAELLTFNVDDFKPFVPMGLKLVSP